MTLVPRTITIYLCIFLILLVLVGMMNHLVKSETFALDSNTKFILKDDAKNCTELVKKLNPSMYLDTTEIGILDELANNTYTNNDLKDKNTYGTNECIIPNSVIQAYNIANCQLGPYMLQQNNPLKDSDIQWKTTNGCVITENNVRYNIKDIAAQLLYIKTRDTEVAKTNMNNQTTTNNTISSELNRNSDDARTQTYTNNDLKNAALTITTGNNAMAGRESELAASESSKAATFNVDAEQASQLDSFMEDKIVGIRWYAYKDYFEFYNTNSGWGQDVDTILTNNFLQNIWDGVIMPFDSGITNEINNYSVITSPDSARNTINTNTTGITMVFEFLYVPDISGYWEVELESDDASYMWMKPMRDLNQTDDGKRNSFFHGTNMMNLNDNPIISNKGLHGMVRVSNRPWLEKDVPYKVYIVQGNQNWGYGNPQGIRFRIRRPSSDLFILQANNQGIGAPIQTLKNKYMVFDTMKKGMLCKVYKGYYDDNTRDFRDNVPLTTVRLKEAYNARKDYFSIGGHGIDKTSSFSKDGTELVVTGNHSVIVNSGGRRYLNPDRVKTHNTGGYDATWYYPFDSKTNTNTLTRSLSMFGYFVPEMSGEYIFFFAGDDAMYLWWGDGKAKDTVRSGLTYSGFDTAYGPSTSMVSTPGTHWIVSKPFPKKVEKGQIYPVRVVQGDWGGHNILVFCYKNPKNNLIYDLTKEFRF